MTRFLLSLLLLGLALCPQTSPAADPAYTPTTMIKAISDELDRIATALESVKDEASATKAATQIRTATDNITRIAWKSQGMKMPNQATGQSLVEKLAQKIHEVETRFAKARPQIEAAGPKTLEALSPSLQYFEGAMEAAAKEFAKLDTPK
jgi:hypothetical protein